MSTITKISEGNLIQRVLKGWSTFKTKYCPDGQTCNDIATVGRLVFMVWFMYIAMQPIMIFR